jgi:hypothetical protein
VRGDKSDTGIGHCFQVCRGYSVKDSTFSCRARLGTESVTLGLVDNSGEKVLAALLCRVGQTCMMDTTHCRVNRRSLNCRQRYSSSTLQS